MSARINPGHGFSERSARSRKISVALPNDVMDELRQSAASEGVSMGEVIRRAVMACRAPVSAGKVKAIAEAAIRDCEAGAPISAANLARDVLAALHPGDGWQGMRPMSDAPKGRARTPILARIRADLADTDPHYGMSNAAAYAGRFVVISHPGVAEDGFDIGWSLHGPFGHGLGSDSFFEGWWHLPAALTGEETV